MPRNIPPPYKESGDSGQLMLSHHVQVCREVTLGRAGNVATLTHPEIFDVESVTLVCLLSVFCLKLTWNCVLCRANFAPVAQPCLQSHNKGVENSPVSVERIGAVS